MRALQQNRAQSRLLCFLSNVSICWMRLPEVNVELFCGISANFILSLKGKRMKAYRARHLQADFFFNRAPLLAQVSLLALSSRSPRAFFTLASRFLHARLALSSRLPHAFLCSPVKHKIMANMPQFAVLDKATG